MGAQLTKIGPVIIDLALFVSVPSVSFSYDAATSGSYPVLGAQNRSESFAFKSTDPLEFGINMRAIYAFSMGKIIFTTCYDQYSIPVSFSGKLYSSSNAATQTVVYGSSSSTILTDVVFAQKITDKCEILYSAGFTFIKEDLSKNTDAAPASTDGSIWGTTAINDSRTTETCIIPIGIAASFRTTEKLSLRMGLRKYIWAPVDSKYKGSSASGAARAVYQDNLGDSDHMYTSAGIGYAIIESCTLDLVIETSYFNLSRNEGKDAMVFAGAALKYTY